MAALMTKKRIVFLTLSVATMILLLAGAMFGQAAQKGSGTAYRYLSMFSEVFELVKSNYVDPVSSEQLMDGAFTGVTDAIDEFSYYVPPAQMAAYKNFSDVEDNGVGLVVTKRFGYAFVVSPVAGSPAAKAGIERGDFIEKIDGQPTQKLAVWQVRNALRTDKQVKLQIIRGGQTKRDDFTIQSGSFHPLAVTSEIINGIAYIKVPYFEKETAEQFKAALEDVHKRGMRKLIVDLRGNAAGSVEEAIEAADELLTSGLITALEGKNVESKKWQADRDSSFTGEVQILTDASTASGAEIFASAIHGNSRGKVVGVTTYGKAIQQRFITLPSGGGVQMTVAHYTTPDLKPIKETGIRPDVIVDLTSQAIVDPNAKESTKKKEDLILNKALQLFGAAPVGEKKAA